MSLSLEDADVRRRNRLHGGSRLRARTRPRLRLGHTDLVPPPRIPWREALIIRNERRSWFLLFAMLACSAGLVLVAVTNRGEHGAWTYWAGAAWMLVVAAYGGFCVVWHRRRRGGS